MKKLLVFIHTMKHDTTGLSRSIRYSEKSLLKESIQSIYFNYGSIRSYLNLLKIFPKPDLILFNGIMVVTRHWLGIAFFRIVCQMKIPIMIYWHETEWGLDNSFKWWPRNTDRFLKILNKKEVVHLVTSKRAVEFVYKITGCSTSKIDVVYECVPDRFKQSEKTNDLPLVSPNESIIIGIGSIQPRKGTDIFIQTAIYVLQKEKNVKFIWAGSGEKFPEFEENCRNLIDQSGFKDKIILAGYISPIYSLLHKSQIVYIPSRDDPLPLTGLEAMSFGKLIVCFDVGGLPEAIKGKGYIVDEIDPEKVAKIILGIIAGEKDRQHKEVRKDYLKKFTPEVFAKRLAAIVKRQFAQ